MDQFKVLDSKVSLVSREETDSDIKDLLICGSGMVKDNIKIQPLVEGYVNQMFKVQVSDENLLVRVFTDRTSAITNPDRVVLSMRAVQHAGLGADVLAYFNNGVVYRYLPGEPTDPNEKIYNNPELRVRIVQKVARFNQIDPTGIEIRGQTLNSESSNPDPLRIVLDNIPEDFNGSALFKSDVPTFMTKKSLQQEVDWLGSIVLHLNLHKVFIHGDLWWPHILYDSNKDEISFIDFDAAGYNYFPVDLVYVMTFMKVCPSPATFEQLSEEEERNLCRVYIKETRKLEGKVTEVTNQDVDILYAISRVFKMYVWFVVSNSNLKVGLLDDSVLFMAIDTEQQYRLAKDEYRNYKEKHGDVLQLARQWRP